MKKLVMLLGSVAFITSFIFTGCTGGKDEQKVENAIAGDVVELEGQQDQYGWFPHMRLTFEGDVLKEVYFDYVNDAGDKKSQDEEYNSTMKEKTGISVKEAMENLRSQLIEKQDPAQVDTVTGATQTSTEFIGMATEGFERREKGENSANNYNQGDPTTTEDDKQDDSNYNTGGDGSPNAAENKDQESEKSDTSSK